MKIALINPPNPDPPPSYYGPHYGLSLLGAILERAGCAVKGHDFDLRTRAEALAELPRMIAREAPDLVGVSCLSSNRWSAFSIADEVKRLSPGAAVVIGGPFATLEPEFVLKRCRADFVAVGDGEETLAELAQALEDGRSPGAVRGIAYRWGRSARRAPRREPFQAVDSLPYPAFHLFDAAAELERRRRPEAEALAGPVSTAGRRCLAMHSALMVLGSRGCVYRCVYCPMSRFRGPVRRHSPEYFLGMVEHLGKAYAQRHMVFGDNFFTLERDWVRQVCDGLLAKRLGIEWICMTRPDAVDEDLLLKMAEAGCREISYGLESASPKVQKLIGKRMALKKVAPAFEATRRAGISATLMLMVGNPGESRQTVRETAGFARGLRPDRVLVHTTKVYPGTALHDLADQQGIIPPDLYDRDDPHPPPYTGELSREELRDLKELLQPRTAYLAAAAGCVNGCCKLRSSPAAAPAPLEPLLALASRRAERIVLGGGEPFLRKDLPVLLETGVKLQIHGLWFYTTARPLAGRACEPLLKGDLARGIVVPLFSPEPSAHDQRSRVPGALLQTRLGMLRWRKAGGAVHAWAFLLRDNIDRLAEWLRWMAGHGVSKAVFLYGRSPAGWGKAPWEDLPRMREAARAIGEVREPAARLGVTVSVFGIPECLVSDEAIPHEEPRCPFDESLPWEGEPMELGFLRRSEMKKKPAACRECRSGELCEGVWKEYLEFHGDEEFRAI